MPGYAKFMKDMVTEKRSVTFEDDGRLQHISAISTRSLVQKNEDPGAFTILCNIGLLHFAKALYDLGASINLMPLSIYNEEANWDTPDVLVKMESFKFSADFVIMTVRWILKCLLFLGGRSLLPSGELETVSTISYRLESTSEVQIEERLGVEALEVVIINFESDGIEEYGSLVAALD
ncbi:hypothetical protein EJD97_001355 [Solanum chilense]|uniref:Uncharacterized protein n=1 Tax=Solanum chilense TaxID=4083 RepID=A0A6N2BZS1_SOLCI|nr:hypothetical protein EJD97_001355 [Solanum chilense]